MKIEELNNELINTYNYITKKNLLSLLDQISNKEFADCLALLNKLYNNDETCKKIVDNGNKDELIGYLESQNSKIKDDYGSALTGGFYLDGLPLEIEEHDFNRIYKRFKEKHHYHENNSFEEHLLINGFTLKDATSHTAHVYVEDYLNWHNLLRDFYDDIMNGNFQTIIETYNNRFTYPDLIKLLQLSTIKFHDILTDIEKPIIK